MKPAVVYDGDCPFCANYVELLKLRETWPDLELVNARESPDHPAAAKVRHAGLVIDDGMAVVAGDQIYHGADAMHRLSRYGGSLNRNLFRSRAVARTLYPFLRWGRMIVLRLLGRRKLGF